MKRLYVLLVVVVLVSLLAIATGSVAAGPTPIKDGGGGDWSHVCLTQDRLNIFVRSENIIQYECTGVSTYAWAETCENVAVLGYTLSDGGGIFVQCINF